MENTSNNDDFVMVKGFPIKEVFEDFAGNQITFRITCKTVDNFFLAEANELTDDGYHFMTSSNDDPYHAVDRLRKKIKNLLAIKHLEKRKDFPLEVINDTMRGHIGCDSLHGIHLFVDGKILSPSALYNTLATYEGWQFKLTLVDPDEDVTEI